VHLSRRHRPGIGTLDARQNRSESLTRVLSLFFSLHLNGALR
jgi:hypothetical protein